MSTLDTARAVTCCFAGHRPQKLPFNFNSQDTKSNRFIQSVITAIKQAYSDGYRVFLCGGAAGFDLICGATILNIKSQLPDAKLYCILPYQKWEPNVFAQWRHLFKRVVSECDRIKYITENEAPGSRILRSHALIDHSSRVIAYFDGDPGGTSHLLGYAQTKKINVINLFNPERKIVKLNYQID